MNTQTSSNLTMWGAVAVGCLLVFVGSIWLLFLGFGSEGSTVVAVNERALSDDTSEAREAKTTATPQSTPPSVVTVEPQTDVDSEPASWAIPVVLETDLGTGSREFSAITLNEATNRIMIADDEGRLYEFDLDDNGVPTTPPLHTWEVRVGAGDIEGLAWMFDSTYVLAHENDGRLTVVALETGSATIDAEHLVRTIDTGIREQDGNGLEGVAYIAGRGDSERFVVVQERPPLLVEIDSDGTIGQQIPIGLGLADVSDVWIDHRGNVVLVSDEDRVVITSSIGSDGDLAVLESLSLTLETGRFEQPEGVGGSADGSRLFIVGETPGSGRFSFGVWNVQPAS